MPRSPTSRPDGPATRPGAPGRAAPVDDYEFRHSGRRAAGHGGGALDPAQSPGDAPGRPSGDASMAGRGHTPQRSLKRETDEELEGRSGPYVRSGERKQSK
ncbi:hypothetical protein [Bordetella petrii]|uniref:hypothetical protein n=1 Tax=Bordetella petrii TaxID=94624 RepID=UPI003734B2D3